jgi:dihydroxyacid dehydratase/phosphogluconate dehydratase
VEGWQSPMVEHRSSQWYAGTDRNSYIHRAWMRRGMPAHAFDGRPHIAIANTASDLTPCNAHFNEVAESVKQGVYEAGGIPLNLPVVSLGETQVRPTAMLWRNMAAMAIEEMLRANPIDGVVLLGGCDKTIPALLMAACSVDLPAVVIPGGPMLTGTFRGMALGCGTDVWRLSEEVRAGELSQEHFLKSESSMIRSRGHCNTMGTASTMAVVAEALGTTIPGLAGTPAADSRLLEAAHETGRLAVELVEQGVANMPLPSKLLRQGVRDMVRICDGRMSGTAYGTVVLHVTPEAAAGGPLGLVRTGDVIVLDVPRRRIDIDIPAAELAARTPAPEAVAAFAAPRRGWERLYVNTVLQADTGADLDFLVGSSGDRVSRESH